MNAIPIRIYGDPVLREKAREVERFDSDLRALVERMRDTLYYSQAVGLAATQVGDSRRLFVLDAQDGAGFQVFVNPEILGGEGRETAEEGCMSLPGIYVEIERDRTVRIRYRGLEGESREIEGSGLFGRIIQHETDHLEGVLISDRAGFFSRKLIAGKLRKLEQGVIL
ncbi:MAG TPA: peptide deformylase [bacterium]|nr:peptide deformylase [bacterium]HPQ67022.1 peptide deformylase [bacterium]